MNLLSFPSHVPNAFLFPHATWCGWPIQLSCKGKGYITCGLSEWVISAVYCGFEPQTREPRRHGTEWVRQHEWVSEFWKGSVIWEQNFRCSTTCRQYVSWCVLMQCFVPWLVFVLRNNFHLSSSCPHCCTYSFFFFYSVVVPKNLSWISCLVSASTLGPPRVSPFRIKSNDDLMKFSLAKYEDDKRFHASKGKEK